MSRMLRGAAIALLTVSLLPHSARADAAAGSVTAVSGPVSIRPAGGAFHDARVGETLVPGEEIKTGPHGDAHLLWSNGGEFELLPESDLVVPADQGVLLQAGQVWAKFEHKLLAPFTFHAPSANAVVRGTILGVSILPDGGTHVAVLEGLVEVSGRAGSAHLMLTPGQAVTISPLGSLGPTEPVTRMEREQGPHRVGMIGPVPGERPHEPGPGGPQRPDADDARGMPGRPEAAAPRPGFGWFAQNRAAVRLEALRAHELRPGEPFDRHRRDDHDERVPDVAASADPEHTFPDGRPRAEMPPCPPPQPGTPPTGAQCPPPPQGQPQ